MICARTTTARRREFFPLVIVSYDDRVQKPTAAELPFDALFKRRQDVVFMRSEWDNPDAAVTVSLWCLG